MERRPDDTTPPLAGRRILVVDDQDTVRNLLRVALTEAGAVVRTAADGQAALAAIKQEAPEIILLDLAMPGMDGWQVLQALSGSPDTARIPVVLETSAEDFASFSRARTQGVAAFISKPFRLSEVVETCRRITGGARPLQGRDEPADLTPTASLRDPSGRLIATGRLLDQDERGARMDLDRPLAAGQKVVLHFVNAGGPSSRHAEVRWVRQVERSYHHGLLFEA